jgi:antirestriction protein ArdC
MADITVQITNQFITAIEDGLINVKWVRPWNSLAGVPHNPITGKAYNGMNALIMMLSGVNHAAGYGQWKTKGGQVRKGEKAIDILSPMIKKDSKGDTTLIGFRAVKVFAASQVDGYDMPATGTEFDPITAAENLLNGSGAVINYGGNSAHYVPSKDYIQLPARSDFTGSEEFYSTALHELAHWTGHATRLDRSLNTSRFGDEAYAFEELVAELTSAFLCATTGIHQGYQENHARYIKSWLKVLKNDSKAIMTAASQAQKAHDYIVKLASQEPLEGDSIAA